MNKTIKFKNPAPRNIAFETYPDGSVRQGYLEGSVKISGISYCTEIAFWPDGTVKAGRIDGYAKVNNIKCSGFIYFYPGGKLLSCKAADSVSVTGIYFQSGQYIDFDVNGKPVSGFSSKDQIINEVKIPSGCFFKINRPGKPEIVSIENITGTWSSVVDGMNYECGITSSEFTCGSYSGGGRFGEWGTSCTFREFLQGDLQDFPGSYMADDVNEIISKVEEIHKLISSVEVYKFSVAEKRDGEVDKGRHIKNFSWCEGYDAEYEYNVDVYEKCIVWHLQFDEQWTDHPQNAVQSIDEFLNDGPPDYFRDRNCSNEIAEFVKKLKISE